MSFAAYSAAATADTAAWNGTISTWKQMRAFYSSILGQLGYGTGPFTWRYGPRERTALSRFQGDLGIPVTGQLDSLTVSHLLEAQNALEKADIKLPNLRVNRFGQWFTASGTWKAVTNRLAYPVNATNIECNAIAGNLG
jgi:peptidoglycan hydrolase-like protein with peptidoglycan-binding domain